MKAGNYPLPECMGLEKCYVLNVTGGSVWRSQQAHGVKVKGAKGSTIKTL